MLNVKNICFKSTIDDLKVFKNIEDNLGLVYKKEENIDLSNLNIRTMASKEDDILIFSQGLYPQRIEEKIKKENPHFGIDFWMIKASNVELKNRIEKILLDLKIEMIVV